MRSDLHKTFIYLLFFFSCYLSVSAQPDRDKVEALRVSFINKKLELSGSESEKFWPVYNEYNDRVRAVRRSLRKAYIDAPLKMSEKEAEELNRADIEARQAEVNLHRVYSDKIKTIIGAAKLVRLRIAEEEFKREMINTLKDKNE